MERLVRKPTNLSKIKSTLELWQQEWKRKGLYETLMKKKSPTLITICGWKMKQIPRFQTMEKEVSSAINRYRNRGRRCTFRTRDRFSLIHVTLKGQQDTEEIFSRQLKLGSDNLRI